MPREVYFHSLDAENDKVLSQYNYLDDIETLRAKANTQVGRTFVDFDGNVSVKSDYNRADFEYFRQNISNLSDKDVIRLCDKAYEKVGIVRHTIDILSELLCQGIRLEHREKKKERFFQAWFKAVSGQMVSDRFANTLYRLANVPICVAYGKVNLPDEEKMSKVSANIHETEVPEIPYKRREIPLKYSFLNPCDVEVIGGSATLFLGKPYYCLKVPNNLRSDLSKLNMLGKPELVAKYNNLSEQLKQVVKNNSNLIELDQDKFEIYFYKKDDWQVWAKPIIASVLDDLVMFERLKLADMSALDGAISNIRHWTVGIIDPSNPKNSIIPTKASINKIKNILANSVGGGTMDLVTGPEVKFEESATQVHRFLGAEKYRVTLDNIYDGLGIPPPLRSGASGGSSTNNYVSLKTLIETLRYGRNVLTSFWDKQIAIIQKAMGWKYPAKVVYDQIILSDEGAEKTLLIELLDRGVIDEDAVRRFWGYIPEITKVKVNREHKDREEGRLPPKAGQFHNPQIEQDMKSALVQNGDVTPTEVGVRLKDRKRGEKSRQDKMMEQKDKEIEMRAKTKTAKKKTSKLKSGRPKNVKETKKRKKKPNQKPRTSAELIIWATKAYQIIHDTISPALLSAYGKDNYRKLSRVEAEEAEQIKFGVLANLEPFVAVTPDLLKSYLEQDSLVQPEIVAMAKKLHLKFVKENDREPTLEETRQIQILSYVENSLENF
jgi:hypothetical protein